MSFDLNLIWTQLQEGVVSFVGRLPAFVLALLAFILFFWVAERLSDWLKQFINKRGRSKNAATVIALITRWGLVV